MTLYFWFLSPCSLVVYRNTIFLYIILYPVTLVNLLVIGIWGFFVDFLGFSV